jgi:23S rRNA G2445 N2-methylase RlmL
MCGSGTLLFEAALIASNAAPGLMRPSETWPFRKWADVDKTVRGCERERE